MIKQVWVDILIFAVKRGRPVVLHTVQREQGQAAEKDLPTKKGGESPTSPDPGSNGEPPTLIFTVKDQAAQAHTRCCRVVSCLIRWFNVFEPN
jgi:hypothetical protein